MSTVKAQRERLTKTGSTDADKTYCMTPNIDMQRTEKHTHIKKKESPGERLRSPGTHGKTASTERMERRQQKDISYLVSTCWFKHTTVHNSRLMMANKSPAWAQTALRKMALTIGMEFSGLGLNVGLIQDSLNSINKMFKFNYLTENTIANIMR